MDLLETPEDRAFRMMARAWFAANKPGKLETLDDKRAWHRRLYEAGFVGMGWPKEYGGQGARPMEQAIVADEMARANAPGRDQHAGASASSGRRSSSTAPRRRSSATCRRSSPPTSSGASSTPSRTPGSDLASLRTSAVRQGDEYLVNGQKIWTSRGPNADYGILLARTDPDVPKHQGISLLPDRHAPARRGGAAAQADHRRLASSARFS